MRQKLQFWNVRFVVTMLLAVQLVSLLVLNPDTAYAYSPPTLSDYQTSNWGDATAASEVTASTTWSMGNLVVVAGVSEDNGAPQNTPTASGLTFSLVTSTNTSSNCKVYIWQATAGSNGSGAITSTNDGVTRARGIAAFVYSGSSGLGTNANIVGSAAKTISLARSQDNSAVITAMGDWNAVNDTTVTSSPAGGTVRQATFVTGRSSQFLVDWGDQGAAGTTSYGITNHTGTVQMTGIAVEVKGLPGTLEQEGYRFRADDGSETGATWLASQDTNISRSADVATRLRMLVNGTNNPASAQYQLEWRKVSGPTDWRKISNVSQTGQVIQTVSTGTDDAQQAGTTMTTTGTTIGGSLDATTEWAGIRFQNVTVPKGATITSAFISVVPSATTEDEPLVMMYAEDADNSATFTTGASNISNRTRTTGTAWSSTDLAATGASYHDSPDISSRVQTVINRAGWATGNPVTILVQGGSDTLRDLTIESFENAGANPPKLTINYTYPAPAFELAASANIAASGANTTAQLTAPSGKTTSNFDAGRIQDDENPADAVDLTASNYTELEWSIKAMGSVVAASEVYEFRVTSAGTVLNTYTVTPQWTIVTNTAPGSPTSLAQTKTNDSSIATGDWTSETSIKLTASVSDADAGDTVKICAEVKPIATALTSPAGDGDGCTAAGVSSGGTATVTISGLSADTEYHWQIKAKDAVGAYSAWVGYGGNTENPPTNPAARDFGVDTSAPSTATVFDNTNTVTQPSTSDTTDNGNGSLTTLSATWNAFSGGVSGIQKYEYSIGTTVGGTDIKAWTDNSTGTTIRTGSLSLQTSKTYYVNVRATDNAGNVSSVASSNGQVVAPTINFDIDVSATDSETSPPYSVSFGGLTGGNVSDSPVKVWIDFDSNGQGGGRVYITSVRAGLYSTVSNFTISAVTGNLTSLSTGFGVQGSSATQSAGGPLSISSPYDVVGNNVGITDTTIRNIFSTSASITGGRGSFLLKAKPSVTTPASTDYSETLTLVAAPSY